MEVFLIPRKKSTLNEIRENLEKVEIAVEDLAIVVLTVITLTLSITGIFIMIFESKELYPVLSKASFLGFTVLPWFLMLIGLLIFKELWLIRKRIERR